MTDDDSEQVRRDRERAVEIEAEEERKRQRGQGAGDAAMNPATQQLAANIRPDVVDAPGGPQIVTTQKSRSHDGAPEAQEQERERLASEIAAHQHAAFILPIGDEGFLEFAGALGKIDEINQLGRAFITLEGIAADPWNAVELPLPPNPSLELLRAARDAAQFSADTEHDLMVLALDGGHVPDGWTGGPDDPDVHEYNEARWLQAESRREGLAEMIEELNAPALAQQRAADQVEQSAEAQDRPLTADERQAAKVSGFLDRERAKWAEREAEYQAEHGEGGGEKQTQGQGKGIGRDWGGGISD